MLDEDDHDAVEAAPHGPLVLSEQSPMNGPSYHLQDYDEGELEMIDVPPKVVTFTTLERRFYPLCLGDNPAGLQGAPIAIDWDHVSEIITTVDEYEQQRPATRPPAELRVSWETRWYRLCKAGYGEGEIMHAIKEADKERWRRIRTNESLFLMEIQYFFERIGRAIRNATIRREAKLQEREYYERWNRIHNMRYED